MVFIRGEEIHSGHLATYKYDPFWQSKLQNFIEMAILYRGLMWCDLLAQGSVCQLSETPYLIVSYLTVWLKNVWLKKK